MNLCPRDGQRPIRVARSRSLTRRAWLGGSLFCGFGLIVRVTAAARTAPDDASTQTVDAIREEARRAGLPSFQTSETKHFLGIGDGPDAYRRRALEICQELATVFQKHFRDKGFASLALPEHRLTVVTLKDRASYVKFLGENAGPDVGGHFDLDANRLVIYDFRLPPGDADPAAANAERVNTFTLVHESLHLLTFNTGLLNLKGDVPSCVSEGLAAYGETWRPRARFGQNDSPRREVLAKQPSLVDAWYPFRKLFAEDTLLNEDESQQLAYAQSWVLVSYLMHTPARLRGFRAYLGAIRDRTDATKRLEDATKHLGDLDRLDRDVRKYTARVLEDRS